MANKYLNRHYNGVYSQSIADGIEDSFKSTSWLLSYLANLDIDTAEEKEIDLIGLWIGYKRPYIPEALFSNNAFLLFDVADIPVETGYIYSPEHGLSGLTEAGYPDLSGGRLLGTAEDGVKLPIGMYKEVLKKVAYIKYNGLTLDSLDRLLQLAGIDYTIAYDNDMSLQTVGDEYSYPSTTVYTATATKIDDEHIAIIDFIEGAVKLYMMYWSGNEWSLKGTGLTLPTQNYCIEKISDNTICVASIDSTYVQLSTYTWNGSTTWSVVGNELVTALDGGNNNTCKVIDDTIVLANSPSNDLVVFHWDGTDWAQVGSPYAASLDIADLCYLGDNIIALADQDTSSLRTLTWSGSTWSVMGNALTLGLDNPKISADSSDKIALLNPDDNLLTYYDWDGTDWTLDTNVSVNLDNLGYDLSTGDIVQLNGIETVTILSKGTSTGHILVWHYYKGLNDIIVTFTEAINPIYLYLIELVLNVFMTLPRVFLSTT